jgi:hypothetical protein
MITKSTIMGSKSFFSLRNQFTTYGKTAGWPLGLTAQTRGYFVSSK